LCNFSCGWPIHPGVRVLFLNQTYRPDPVATSQYLARWAEHLAREGHEVTVLTGRRAYHNARVRHAARETLDGVRILRMGGGGGAQAGKLRRVLGFARFLLAALVHATFLPRPDVVVALTSPPLVSVVAALIARLHGARLLAWVMDIHPDAAIAAGLIYRDGVTARVARRLARWSLRRADRIVTLDRHMWQRLVDLGVARDRIEVVPLWMQSDIAFDAEGRDAVRWTRGWDDKFVVMCAGNHGACHPAETLLAAAAELRGEKAILFCWVGGGAQWPELRARAVPPAGRNISLIDYVPRAELAALLSAADLHVVVMGEPFTGLLHPCKVYNLLAVQRPFLYIGPPEGPVADLIREAQLGEAALPFRHGESAALASEIRGRARVMPPPWPAEADLSPWSEEAALKKMTSALSHAVRFLPTADEMPPRRFVPRASCGRAVVSADGGDGAGGRRRGPGTLRRG
jgi:colanic acid biosynthesis glycosyl transferase WcaI